MKLIACIFLFIILLSCDNKPSDRVEEVQLGDTLQQRFYKKDSLVRRINFVDGKKRVQIKYKNGIIQELIEYYPNGKIKLETELESESEKFYSENVYYENGQIEYTGFVNIHKNKKYRTNWWMFYTKTGKLFLITEFYTDNENEIENQRIEMDTIRDKIIDDKSFYFKDKILEKNKDSIKVNIKYYDSRGVLQNILYVKDDRGNEIKKVSSKNQGYDWDLMIPNSNSPFINVSLKTKTGIERYYYTDIR